MLNHENTAMIGAGLGIVVAMKTMGVWTYGEMMKVAMAEYELTRMPWTKNSQMQFEALVFMTIVSFISLVVCVLIGEKMAAKGFGYAFMLLTDTFVFMAIVVPGLISFGKGSRRWFQRLAV